MRHSIRSKIFLAILSVTIVTVCAITVVFYFKSADMIEKNYTENLYARVKQTMTSLDDSLQEVYYVNLKTAVSEELKDKIRAYKQSGSGKDLDGIAETLRSVSGQSKDLTSLYLVLPGERIAVTSEDYPVTRRQLPREEMDQIIQTQQQDAVPLMLTDVVHKEGRQLSCVQAVLADDGEILGYLLANSQERTLFYKYLEPIDDESISEALIIDKNKRIVTSREYEEAGREFEKEYPAGNGMAKGQSKDEIRIFHKSVFSGCSMYLVIQKKEVLKELGQMQVFLGGISGLFLAVALILASSIVRAMYRPIQKMTDTVEKVSGGDLSLRLEVQTKDEIGILSREFNGMLDYIENLIRQVVEEERQKKDAELEALQYQITPHFMYNTLNSIKYAALLKGEKELGGLIGDFVELLQASINKKGTFLTVADEIHILENYIRLQEFRYEGKFDVRYDVAEDALGCYLPRLILQPLVENAILHGIDMKDSQGKLILRGRVEAEVLTLSVIDNGRGMTREQIGLLLNSSAKKTSGLSAIGIPNIKERLELYYEKQGGLLYESSEAGTTASIFLPADREYPKESRRIKNV